MLSTTPKYINKDKKVDTAGWGELIGGVIGGVLGLRSIQLMTGKDGGKELKELTRAVREEGEATRNELSTIRRDLGILLGRGGPNL
jgi:hypothetical protein